MTWGYTVRWTEFPGEHYEVSTSGRETQEEAYQDAFAFAAELGWTPRRWWQFWRWRDTRNKAARPA